MTIAKSTRSKGEGRARGRFATGHKAPKAATTWTPGAMPRRERRAFYREALRAPEATPAMRRWGGWRMTGEAYVPLAVAKTDGIAFAENRTMRAMRALAWGRGGKPHPALAPLAAMRLVWRARDEALRNVHELRAAARKALAPARNQEAA